MSVVWVLGSTPAERATFVGTPCTAARPPVRTTITLYYYYVPYYNCATTYVCNWVLRYRCCFDLTPEAPTPPVDCSVYLSHSTLTPAVMLLAADYHGHGLAHLRHLQRGSDDSARIAKRTGARADARVERWQRTERWQRGDLIKVRFVRT